MIFYCFWEMCLFGYKTDCCIFLPFFERKKEKSHFLCLFAATQKKLIEKEIKGVLPLKRFVIYQYFRASAAFIKLQGVINIISLCPVKFMSRKVLDISFSESSHSCWNETKCWLFREVQLLKSTMTLPPYFLIWSWRQQSLFLWPQEVFVKET